MSPRWWKAFALLGWTLLFVELLARVDDGRGLVLPGTLAVCALIVVVGLLVAADEPPHRRKALSHDRTDARRVRRPGTAGRADP